MDLIWKIGAILILVGVNALCVAAEFALDNARSSRLKTQADAGDKKAARAVRAIQDLDDYLAGAQLGITLTSLALGWIGATTLASFMADAFAGSDSFLSVLALHALATTIVFVCIAYLHIVLGEQTPKLLVLMNPEKVARLAAGPLMLFTHALWPIVRFQTRSARGLLHLLRMHPITHYERANEREEILELLSDSGDDGNMADTHAEMIAKVFDFSSTSVRQAMTPRTDIHAIERTWPLEKVIEEVRNSGSSRLPVYEEDLDHVVGILLAKDLLNFLDNPTAFDAATVMREPYFIPPTMHVDKLLKELQRLNTHLAIIVDEYGGVQGLITLEDLIEEIVGEIFDEFDQVNESQSLEATTEGNSSLSGNFLIQDLNERYKLQLATSDYVTVAGLILAVLGHVPSVGESAHVDGVTFKVVAMDRQRIERVEVALPDSSD